MADAYIVDAVRSPTGRRKGGLSDVHGADLGAHVLKTLVERNGIPDNEYDDVIFGCLDAIGLFSKYIDCSGRAMRSEFWYWVLFVLVLTMVASAIDRAIGRGMLASTLWQLATLIPSCAVEGVGWFTVMSTITDAPVSSPRASWQTSLMNVSVNSVLNVPATTGKAVTMNWA